MLACCEASWNLPSCLAISSLPAFLASWALAASRTLALASTSPVISLMLVHHTKLWLEPSSYFVSLSFSHSFMASGCTSAGGPYVATILAILSIVWCRLVMSPASCLTGPCTPLLKSPGELTPSKVSFLNLLSCWLRCYCSHAAMKDTYTQEQSLRVQIEEGDSSQQRRLQSDHGQRQWTPNFELTPE